MPRSCAFGTMSSTGLTVAEEDGMNSWGHEHVHPRCPGWRGLNQRRELSQETSLLLLLRGL